MGPIIVGALIGVGGSLVGAIAGAVIVMRREIEKATVLD